MTITEARDNVGAAVTFRPPDGPAEDGMITGVSSRHVYVRYCHQHPTANGIATVPELLELPSHVGE